MNKILVIFLFSVVQMAFAQNQIEIAQKAQTALNLFYKNPTTSPLQKADLKTFNHLDFYPISDKYIVEARFVRAQKDCIFEMKTSGSRLPKYTIYGSLYFEIEGKSFKLNVYQNKDANRKAEYSNYLFLPFSDSTCGQTSYIGGRYMDLQLPLKETVILNFNTAYNPYCAYNHQYSCPIIPLENDLPIAILAGVKKYHD
ncbi:hypothetical protein B0A58_02655 [Flavobacterium branchiophilum NBRC 15030 = ATCC 35035]|uniref:DUF1684 domain-containing protein n=1 Tax=Flavobacterium branchiophilum TaxID=55197 RepID=A0A543G682_9FLAO|nr:DUF1684 domain-containing protein [Flavobacterium branchiophilum]OXA80229.1 hypothetical protein B0A58_02655 [Flavobacterium branchiophilum NBRC 15030 = ATCC 35035]TQM41593.1 hypothetical protein BC670_2578 [Flavobacterium branchiophilum]GEM55648.1 hypothetical protein FB1_18690 [Flavobacterium branchiophilum NBRC 15030 = ATCC 35035]